MKGNLMHVIINKKISVAEANKILSEGNILIIKTKVEEPKPRRYRAGPYWIVRNKK